MSHLRTLEQLCSGSVEGRSLRGRKVLVRVDFNVPRSGDRIVDDTRIREALPTLRSLSKAGARSVLISHGGRPKGRVVPEMSLRPVVGSLAELTGKEVGFGSDCVGELAASTVREVPDGGLCLLENLRFHSGEEANDEDFAAALARHADLYVNDAFGCCHRAHASIVGLPAGMESAVAGSLLEKEIEAFDRLLSCREHPFVAILGGAKIKGKIDTIDHLLTRIDSLLIGGSMANTFLAAQGHDLGASRLAAEEVEVAHSILQRAREVGVGIGLPTDLVVTDRLEQGDGAPRNIETVTPERVPSGSRAVDIGPRTVATFVDLLRQARIVFWNGPPGVFEVEPFDSGSRELARAVADTKAYTVAGGGETVTVVNLAGVAGRIDHVSTGGGASLALVAGKPLAGIVALEEAA